MKLAKLLEGVTDKKLADVEIEHFTTISQQVYNDCLFICIKGMKFDSHSCAKEIHDNFNAWIITERDLELERQIIVKDTREAYAYICANWFYNPHKKLKFIGVTGTNGKTTITTVIKKIFDDAHIPSALIGTSEYRIRDKIYHSLRTTPESYELFDLLSRAVEDGCEYVIMEVSSQALEQKRTAPIHFNQAIFTNLTQDHLDVHGTMEKYYQAKKLLFQKCDTAFINIDDKYGQRYYDEINCNKKSYGLSDKSDYYCFNVTIYSIGNTFWFTDSIKSYYISFCMPGIYNVYNAIAIISVCIDVGIDVNDIISSLSNFSGVKGRSEIIPTGKDFTVICDYAHTPDALHNLLPEVRKFTTNRLICLFGCGGDRDRTKRPLMGEAAAKYSDMMIITSDNPRNENPDDIIKDILEGIDKEFEDYVIIPNRHEAINYAIQNAQKGDIIVLAGKGHEDYQILENNQIIEFDERKIVRDALAKLN